VRDLSIDCGAIKRTSQKAYQRREILLDGRETRFQINEQRTNLFSWLKVAVASSAKKQLKKVSALPSPLLSAKSIGATATVKVAPLQ